MSGLTLLQAAMDLAAFGKIGIGIGAGLAAIGAGIEMVIAKHETIQWEEVEVLSDTERGAGGFGSSGVK